MNRVRMKYGGSGTIWALAILWFATAFGHAADPSPVSKVDFVRDIRPILSDACFKCHGPDENTRKAKLRLDTKEGALAEVSDGQYVIKPGDLAKSEVYRRITSADPDEKMPPPDSLLSLTEAQVDLIRQWIQQGAEWEVHWAFKPLPRQAPIPNVSQSEWTRNPIDRFILSRLEQEQLRPAPEASKEKLIRRLTFDLTGLPPTIDEVEAFLKDPSPSAYEKAVDRLLSSDAYGERMALDWLDVARYADTHGYQADRYRPMWPWRDWVIKAFNQNLPYDQFITWQLAGDLLPDATKEQRLATAFNRLHMQTEEGGSVEEEFRVAYVVDRVNTAGTAFMALTLDCARCHDHKYDPITQREFYQLFSFFNNIDESGQTSHFTDSMPVPTLLLTDDKTDQLLASLRKKIRQKEAEEPLLRKQAQSAFEQWLKAKSAEPKITGLLAHYPLDEVSSNKTANVLNPKQPGDVFEDPRPVPGRFGQGLSFNGENGLQLKGVGLFSRVDPFTISLWISTPNHAKRAVVLHRSMASLDAGSRGYEILIENGRLAVGLHHMWPNNSIQITTKAHIPTNTWIHLSVAYDGSSQAKGLKLYLDGRLAEVEVIRDNLFKDITYERGDPALTIGQRFRDSGFKGGQVDEVKIFDRPLTPLEIAHLSGRRQLLELLDKDAAELTEQERDALFDYFQANFNPVHRRYREALRSLRSEENQLVQSIPEIMAMVEMPTPRPAYLLKRGAYDAPAEPVAAGTPASMPPFDERLPKNRLGLAQWLLRPDHPLTARVTVNRYWQAVFGRGLVATPDNFGSQGELPTHPELLDWLARDFVDHGWNLKRLIKLMVMSATYRQSSEGAADAIAKDPDNRLLARGPRYRLSAEMIRDQALAASGLLVRTLGGPSVKPYQPDGLWEEKSGARYEPDKGSGLYRRSLYTFWKRTVPHPAMIAFDAAERNVCVAHRQTTSTPLQALVLLNDPQYVEASRLIAERMLKEGGPTLADRLVFAFRLLTSRKPNDRELSVLNRLYEEQLDLYRQNPTSALSLLTVGEHPSEPAFDPIEAAAAAAVASAILNYDETVMKR